MGKRINKLIAVLFVAMYICKMVIFIEAAPNKMMWIFPAVMFFIVEMMWTYIMYRQNKYIELCEKKIQLLEEKIEHNGKEDNVQELKAFDK